MMNGFLRSSPLALPLQPARSLGLCSGSERGTTSNGSDMHASVRADRFCGIWSTDEGTG